MDEKFLTKLIEDLMHTEESEFARKALDYFDGQQHEWMEKALSNPQYGRRKWRERGMKPVYRNITGMVVEKSGLLFNNKSPLVDVYIGNQSTPNSSQSERLQMLMDDAGWVEFFTNFDSTVRLLKTALVLVQYDSDSGKLIFDALHRGNSGIVLDQNHNVQMLVYLASGENDSVERYRVYTADQIIHVEEVKEKMHIVGMEPNPYGIVPIAEFYDTNTPRCGFWVEAPQDLVNLNETYNFHLIDTDFAASWSKLMTLFTNCEIESGSSTEFEVQEIYNQPLPRLTPVEDGLIGGPNRIVKLNTTGVDSPFVEYKGPQVNLEPIDKIYSQWVRDVAADWSVRIKSSSDSVADSGFKLMVEEMDNLDLRKKRQKMFQRGFGRLFDVIKVVINYHIPNYFNQESKLFLEFPEPSLPIDRKVQEEIWSIRIAEGRASRVDYFREVHGMTMEEAIQKVQEINRLNNIINSPPTNQTN